MYYDFKIELDPKYHSTNIVKEGDDIHLLVYGGSSDSKLGWLSQDVSYQSEGYYGQAKEGIDFNFVGSVDPLDNDRPDRIFDSRDLIPQSYVVRTFNDDWQGYENEKPESILFTLDDYLNKGIIVDNKDSLVIIEESIKEYPTEEELIKQGYESTLHNYYQVAFGREPEKSALDFWTTSIISGQIEVLDVADALIGSDEFKLNPLMSLGTEEAFIQTLYLNGRGSMVSTEGVSYWLDYKETYAQDRAGLLNHISAYQDIDPWNTQPYTELTPTSAVINGETVYIYPSI